MPAAKSSRRSSLARSESAMSLWSHTLETCVR